MLSRPRPSIDHFLLTPKKYLPSLLSTTSLGTRGPVYSIILLPLGIRSTANKPRPVTERLTAKSRLACFMVGNISIQLLHKLGENSRSLFSFGVRRTPND